MIKSADSILTNSSLCHNQENKCVLKFTNVLAAELLDELANALGRPFDPALPNWVLLLAKPLNVLYRIETPKTYLHTTDFWGVESFEITGLATRTTAHFSTCRVHRFAPKAYHVDDQSHLQAELVEIIRNGVHQPNLATRSNSDWHKYAFRTLGFPFREGHAPSGASLPNDRSQIFTQWDNAHPEKQTVYSAFSRQLSNNVTTQGTGFTGFPRFGSDENGRLIHEELQSISNGEIEVVANKVAGGQVWKWLWRGIDFLNVADFGRGIQSAMGQVGWLMPTEGGDRGSFGSPIVQFHAEDAKTHYSNCIPLEWNPDDYFFGDRHHPVFIDGIEFARRVQLSPDIPLPQGMKDRVASYTTYLNLAYELNSGSIEVPTGYLQSKYDHCWLIDVKTTPHNTAHYLGQNQTASYSHSGAVILANTNDGANPGGRAMAVYGVQRSDGGSVNGFSLWCNLGDTKKWSATADSPFQRGTNTFRTFIVTGTVNEVVEIVWKMIDARVGFGNN